MTIQGHCRHGPCGSGINKLMRKHSIKHKTIRLQKL